MNTVIGEIGTGVATAGTVIDYMASAFVRSLVLTLISGYFRYDGMHGQGLTL